MPEHTRREPGALRRISAAALALASLAGAGAAARAQDLQPRPYANLPRSANFLAVGYAHTDGRVVTDRTAPLRDVDLRADSLIATYVRSLDVFGCSGNLRVAAAFTGALAEGQLSGQSLKSDVSGLGDPLVRFSLNFYGAPALSAADFARYRQDVIVGASVQVSVPLGQYDSARLLNLGANRWSIRPQIGASKSLGRWFLEAAAGVTFYTDNRDFLEGRELSRDPLYSAQAFAVYTFGPDRSVAVGADYYAGGRATVDGRASRHAQSSSRLAASLLLPLGRRGSLRLFASTGLTVRIGADFNLVGVAYQYRWGAGL